MGLARRVLAIAVVAAACRAPTTPAPAPRRSPSPPPPTPSAAAPGLRLSDDVAPLGYDLTLELDPASARFHGSVAIRVHLARPAARIWLHAASLDIARATFRAAPAGAADEPLAALADTGGDDMRAFAFGRTLPAGDIALAFTYDGDVGADEEGLFREPTADGDLLVSQAESMFARRILPCFDEPRWKVPWRVTLVVPPDHRALANAAEVSRSELPDHRVAFRFADTPPMPSYLLAVAVGKFAVVDLGTVGRRRVPVRIALAHADAGQTALVRAWLPKLVAELEAYFDTPLPWPKLDLVAVPELFGAMENPGLITFHRDILVGSPGDPASVRELARIAGHELAHLWFGDWVTFAWWSDLWLAESFASWASDKVAAHAGAFTEAPLDAALSRRRALAADAAIGARPLERTLATSHDAEDAFDAIAYDKGEAVLAMFEHFVGEVPFRTAIRAYLAAHAGGTATSNDLIAAMSRATSPQVGAALAAYVATSGAPVLAITCERGKPIARTQPSGSAAGIAIPACVRWPGGGTCVLVEPGAAASLGATCPAWIAGNAAGLGYYDVAVAPGLAPPATALSPLERIARGDDLAAAIARGDLAAGPALAELHALAASGADLEGGLGALAIAQVLDPMVDDAHRPAWTRTLDRELAPLSRALGTRFARGRASFLDEERADRIARDALAQLGVSTANTTRANRALDAWAASRAPDRTAALARALGPDLAGAPALDAAHTAIARRAITGATTTADRRALLPALAGAPPDLAGAAVALALADPGFPAATDVLASYLARGATRTETWRSVARHVVDIVEVDADGDATTTLLAALAHHCDPAIRADIARAFAIDLPTPAARAALPRTLATIDRCVTRAAALGTAWP